MFQSNRLYLLQAQARAAADLTSVQAEATAAEAALLAEALNFQVGNPSSAAALAGGLHNRASALAAIAERERIAQARADALDAALVSFDAAFS